MAYESWRAPVDLEMGNRGCAREHGKMPPAGRRWQARKFVSKCLQVMVVEMVSDIAQVWMGVVLVDSLADVVVHMYWERCMMVELKPCSQ